MMEEEPDRILTIGGKSLSEPFSFGVKDEIWPLGDRREAVEQACEWLASAAVVSLNQAIVDEEEWNPLVFMSGVLETEIYVQIPKDSERVFRVMCGEDCSPDKCWEVFALMISRLKKLSADEVEKEVEPIIHPDGTAMATVIGNWQPWPVIAQALAELIKWYLQVPDDDADLEIEEGYMEDEESLEDPEDEEPVN